MELKNKMTFAFIVHEHDVFHFPALGASRRNLKETSFSEELYIFFVKPKCSKSVAFHAFIVSQIANSHDTGQLYFDIIDSLGYQSVDYQGRVDIVVPVGSLPSQSGCNFRLESSRL